MNIKNPKSKSWCSVKATKGTMRYLWDGNRANIKMSNIPGNKVGDASRLDMITK